MMIDILLLTMLTLQDSILLEFSMVMVSRSSIILFISLFICLLDHVQIIAHLSYIYKQGEAMLVSCAQRNIVPNLLRP